MLSGKKVVEKEAKLNQLLKENSRIIDSLTRALIDSSSKILLVLTEGKMAYANPSAIKAMGYSQKELQGLHFDELFVSSHSNLNPKGLLNKIISQKNFKQKLEVTLHTKGGNIRWYAASVTRCFWKQKPSLLIALEDTNFQNNKTDIPNQIDDNYRNALRASRHSVWFYNFSTGESFVSPEFFEALGFKNYTCELTIEGWRRILQPDSRDEFQKLVYNTQQSKNFPSYWEYKAHDHGGHNRWFASVAKVTDWDLSGYPIKVMGIHMDITEQKKKIADKEENYNFFKGLVHNLQDGLIFFDEKGIIVEWNPAIESITGVKRNEAIGKFIGDIGGFIPSQQRTSPFQQVSIKEIFNSNIFSGINPYEGKTLESCVKPINGEVRTIHKSISVIKTTSGLRFALTVKDVTPSYHNLQKLEKNEERLKLAMAAGKVGVWDIDIVTGENYFSPMAFNMLGYMPWEVEPTLEMLKEHIHPDDLQRYEQTIKPFLISGTSIVLEIRMRKKNGDYAWILSKNRLLRDVYGKALRLTGTITDITDQKNIELELLQSQAELKRNIQQHEALSEISYLFSTNSTLANKCNEVIETLGRFTNASRVYIFENNWEKRISVNTHEWCNEGIEPQISNLQEEPLDSILSWMAGKEFIMSNNLSVDLPADFAQIMTAQGIQSFVIFPIQANGNVFGYIGFDECTHQRVWEKAEIELLKTIANIISFAFERENSLKNFRQNEQNYKELTNWLSYAVIELAADGRISFINTSGMNLLGVSTKDVLKGVSLWDFLTKESLSLLQKELANNKSPKEPLKVNLSLRGDKSKTLLLHVKPKSLEDGSVNYSVLAIIQDKQ